VYSVPAALVAVVRVAADRSYLRLEFVFLEAVAAAALAPTSPITIKPVPVIPADSEDGFARHHPQEH